MPDLYNLPLDHEIEVMTAEEIRDRYPKLHNQRIKLREEAQSTSSQRDKLGVLHQIAIITCILEQMDDRLINLDPDNIL